MKNLAKVLLVVSFVVLLSTPLFPQNYLEVNFSDIAVTMSYPDSWEVSREHILLLLMPKNKDIVLELEVLGENLNQIVQESIDNMINTFPLDTNIIRREFKVNDLTVKELSLVTTDKITVNYFFVVSPKKKVLKLYFSAPEAEILKHKNDLKYIKEHFAPIK